MNGVMVWIPFSQCIDLPLIYSCRVSQTPNVSCITSEYSRSSYRNHSEYKDRSLRIVIDYIVYRYKDLIPMFGILNEPTGMDVGPLSNLYVCFITEIHLRPNLTHIRSYIEVHKMIRDITGVGAGNGPYISVMSGKLSHSMILEFLIILPIQGLLTRKDSSVLIALLWSYTLTLLSRVRVPRISSLLSHELAANIAP